MTPHHPGSSSAQVLDAVVVAVLVVGLVGYLALVRSSRGRGPWLARRTACWCLGLACLAAYTCPEPGNRYLEWRNCRRPLPPPAVVGRKT